MCENPEDLQIRTVLNLIKPGTVLVGGMHKIAEPTLTSSNTMLLQTINQSLHKWI